MSSLPQATDALTDVRHAMAAARKAVRRCALTPHEAPHLDELIQMIRDCVDEAAGLYPALAAAISFSCAAAALPEPVHPAAAEVADRLRAAGVQVTASGRRPHQAAREIWQHHVRTPLRATRP
jgi:hypothetical protein